MTEWSRRGALWLGIAAALAAVSPPVHALVHDLFSIHMTQHLVLMVVAAPLVAFGRPLRIRVPPLLVVALNAVVLWAWHAPALYREALRNDFLHIVEHATFFAVAVLLWNFVLNASETELPGRVLAVFVSGLQSSALGAILAFASVVLYPGHDSARFGLTALEDQQLAGTIMWIPAGFIYLATMVVLLYGWFARMERSSASVGE